MDEIAPQVGSLTTLNVEGSWHWNTMLAGTPRQELASAIGRIMPSRRWFGSKTRQIASVEILDALPIVDHAQLLIVRVGYDSGPEEIYQVPLAYIANGSDAVINSAARMIIVQLPSGEPLGVLCDALGDAQFCTRLLELFETPGSLSGDDGEMIVLQTPAFDVARGDRSQSLKARLVQAEQSNSSVIYGERLILKILRRVETGINPDVEISEFLTRRGFANSPPLAGALEYKCGDSPWALAMLQAFVPNQGDAWAFTLSWLQQALDAALPQFTQADATRAIPELPPERPLAAARHPLPQGVVGAYEGFLQIAAILATRTAEMHLALIADPSDPDFAPEPFTESDRREFLDRASQYARETFALLRQRSASLSGEVASQAEAVAQLEAIALNRYATLADLPVEVDKIRIHGDYHLGQVLATSGDFMIIDFEGEPVRSITERRRKQLALRDVAGIIRSLHYASCTAATQARQTISDASVLARIDAWTASWYNWSTVAFLAAYCRAAGDEAPFLPHSQDAFAQLLDACLLEKAIYELRYELNNRPDWVYLPLAALSQLLAD